MIASEARAEEIGRAETGGEPGQAFTVFQYEHKPSRLTLFGLEIIASKTLVFNDPRAAAPRNIRSK